MIETWNGVTGREVILNLLSYASLDSFEGKPPKITSQFNLTGFKISIIPFCDLLRRLF